MRRAAGNGRASGETRTAAALGTTVVDSVGLRAQPAREAPNGRASGPLGVTHALFEAGTGSARLVAHRLPPAFRRLLRALQRRVMSVAGLVARRWHRSLQLRVIGTTLVISVAVVAILGIFLIQQIANGLLDSERNAALAQANYGLTYAQSDPNVQSPRGSSTSALISLVSQLQSGSGLGNTYDVVVLQRSTGLAGVTGNLANPKVLADSIPKALRNEVLKEQTSGRPRQFNTMPTTLLGSNGRPVGPALAVGVPISSDDQ